MALSRARRAGDRSRRPTSQRSFAILPISPAIDAHAFAHEVASQLGGATAVLSSESIDADLDQPGIAQVDHDDVGNVRLAYHLQELEATHDHLVFELDAEWTVWSRRALRCADHVVLVASAPAESAIGEHEGEMWSALAQRQRPQVSLVLIHDPDTTLPRGTRRWLDVRDVTSHHHLRRGNDGDLARLGRLLSGRGTSLVLGGGGARGFAHLGVFEVLEELDHPIDMIGGTSIGAVMAVGPGMGWDAATCPGELSAELPAPVRPHVPDHIHPPRRPDHSRVAGHARRRRHRRPLAAVLLCLHEPHPGVPCGA